ncbi:MAG: 50S ribosomal protein L27 [Candidatus Hodgkinia cicadicola]
MPTPEFGVWRQTMQRLKMKMKHPMTLAKNESTALAHKRTGGTCKNGRDSCSKRLGAKAYECNFVKPGCILMRQRGSTWKAGRGTTLAKDYTIMAATSGQVQYSRRFRNINVAS